MEIIKKNYKYNIKKNFKINLQWTEFFKNPKSKIEYEIASGLAMDTLYMNNGHGAYFDWRWIFGSLPNSSMVNRFLLRN